MLPAEIIRKKRDGRELAPAEIDFFLSAYLSGRVADYQMSAFLMAVFFRPLTEREQSALTLAMLRSGRRLSFPGVRLPKCDKHSTGGVGDGVSLSLAPLVASCGVAVPMMSGRGLGHTGGTLDKLEAIPGFRVFLSPRRIATVLKKTGAALFGQTPDIVPADRRMYALRDVTATVESLDLITASIISKKLAEGTDSLVLDVKTGRGAFMKTEKESLALARSLLSSARAGGLRASAFVTDMDRPLGYTAGNALEITEHTALLKGLTGPEGASAELTELVLTLGAEMLRLSGKVRNGREGRILLQSRIRDGKGLEKFRAIIRAQGGDPRVIDDPARLPLSPERARITADADGFLTDMNPLTVGEAAVLLGAGRMKAEDRVDPGAGLRLLKRTGDRVRKGEPIALAYAADRSRLKAGQELFRSALRYAPRPTRNNKPLILHHIRN